MTEFLDLVVVEKFLSCVVVRARSCHRIILEQDGLYICSSCQELQQKLENIPVETEEEAKDDTENLDLEVKMEPEVEVNDGESEVLPHSIFNSEPLRKMSKQLRTKLSCPEGSCKRKFGKYKLLVNHCKLQHSYTEEELPVKLENIKIELEAKGKRRRSSSDSEAPNKCPECDSSFWSHKSLVKHCLSVHSLEREQIPKIRINIKRWEMTSKLPRLEP